MVGKLTRNDTLSASRVPMLLGQSPYATPNDLLAEVLAEIEGRPNPNPFNGNEACDWGDALEETILKTAAERLGLKNLETEFDSAFVHDTLPFAASLDGRADGGIGHEVHSDPSRGIYCVDGPVYVQGLGILESKLTSSRPEERPAPHRGPLQLQGQMIAVNGQCTWGAVCVLYQGIELRIFLYQANAAIQSNIIDAIHDFERRKFDIDWYPVLTSSDGNTAYPRVDNGAPTLELDGENVDWLGQLINAKDAKRAAEADIDEAEAALKEHMGSHEEASGLIGNQRHIVKWPMRNFKAQPAKTTPAKPSKIMRQSTLTVKALSND